MRINTTAPKIDLSNSRKTPIALNILIFIIFSLFCFMLFKNISYPLLWNDESETTMTAKQILKYGYPKVHDGKNIIFLPEQHTNWIGYKEAFDVNIAMPWGHYYFTTIGVLLSNITNDLYQKTALIRIPIATAGLIGLIIFAFILTPFFSNSKTRKVFIAAFFFLELFSVSLLLHMREARYYALVILVSACFFYAFVHFFILSRWSFKKYFISMSFILFLAYQINVIICFTCCLTLTIYELWCRFLTFRSGITKKRKLSFFLTEQIKILLLNITPIFLTLITIFPFLIFFETFETAAKVTAFYGFNFVKYLTQLKRIFHVLSTQEFFYLFLFVKTFQILIWFKTYKDIKRDKKIISSEQKLIKLTSFITIFMICYSLAIARMPFFFTRYFIVLQPMMTLIILTDSYIISRYIFYLTPKRKQFLTRLSFIVGFINSLMICIETKLSYLKEYFFQLTHQYKGPLDYLIPYIKQNYKNPENLILATNYEELSYVYYLNCKVILGYNNKNLEEDLKYQPDIVIFRKKWGHNPQPFNYFLQKASYQRISFPVYDFPVNNIAELDFVTQHQFRTPLALKDEDKTEIYIKTN